MVVMSIAHYSQLQKKLELYSKLAVAESQRVAGDKGRPLSKVTKDIRKQIRAKAYVSSSALNCCQQDFKEIIDYILADNATAHFLLLINRSQSKSLENNPQLGRIPNDDELLRLGYRYLIVLDYLIFYKMEGTTIFVYRTLHGARNYKSLL